MFGNSLDPRMLAVAVGRARPLFILPPRLNICILKDIGYSFVTFIVFILFILYNDCKAVSFLKSKIRIFIPVIVVLCIILYAVFAMPSIERHTWVLSFAHHTEPYFVVAHKAGYDHSDDNFFASSKEVELTCVASDGKLTITDKTNGKTYEGTYKASSWNRRSGQSYTVVIDGKEGTANVTRGSKTGISPTLFISVDGYGLTFGVR